MLQGNMSEFSEKPPVTILRTCPPLSPSFQFFWSELQPFTKARKSRKTHIPDTQAQPGDTHKVAFWQSADSVIVRKNPRGNP